MAKSGFASSSFGRALFAASLGYVGAAGLLTASGAALAQSSPADFYKGKQMKFIIRSDAGGGYDLASRLLGSHMVRHIPGNPTIIPQNMPGAGGIVAANYVGEIAPKDGTILTMIGQALPMDQSLDLTPSFKADLRTFGWIGNLGDSNLLSYVWHTSPIKSIEDAKKTEAKLGATGAGSPGTWLPIVYNEVLGTKFKLIHGYKGGNDVKLAMERGEVDGYSANPWSALNAASPELFKNKQITILVQVGVRKEKALPDVPLLSELASDADGTSVLEFVSKSLAVGRPVGTTPGVPAARLAALRKAFDDTLLDPVFLADAKQQGIEIDPVSGVDLERMINDVIGADKKIKDRVKAVLPQR